VSKTKNSATRPLKNSTTSFCYTIFMRHKTKRGGLVFVIVLFLVLSLGWAKRNAIYDWGRLRNYQAPSQVMQLAADTTMTTQASHLFYVNHPTIQDKNSFNASCPNNGGEQTIVLGCYHARQAGIFLYTVTDPQLNGVMQVTAAHEVLHAIYERLSSKQRNHVNKLLEDYYRNDLKDKRLLDIIEAYKKTEPSDVTNEMHSIFGTEVGKLSPDLENYYGQYFSDRARIISYSKHYEAAFTSRKSQADSILQQVKDIEQQLSALKTQIDTKESDLKSKRLTIDSQRSTASDIDAYNAQVRAYNSELVQYKNDIAIYNQLVAQHNQLLAQYQQIAVEASQLLKELDSRSQSISDQ